MSTTSTEALREPMTEPTSRIDAAYSDEDARLRDSVEQARTAAQREAGARHVGDYLGAQPEDGALTHLFASHLDGYRGWRWAVTIAASGPELPVTVSEVVLLPGPDALTGPRWVPWQDRVRAGDLGVGDRMPAAEGDERLVPGYTESDDPAVEDVALDLGLGRRQVMSHLGRLRAAKRWRGGEFGPRSDMARSAPGRCGTCGFYLPLAGSLRAAFGVCGNEIAPADGKVVHAEYGCGAHSDTEADSRPAVPVTETVYDDTNVDVESRS